MKLDGLNLKELKAIAKERGLNSKDAILYGVVQSRAAWVKLLTMNPEKAQQKAVKSKAIVSINSVNGYKANKKRTILGLKRLPEIKTIVYFYGAKKS